MRDLEAILDKQPFLAGLEEQHRRLVVGCAHNRRFDTGAYLLREGAPADEFYLIREGTVALEIAPPDKTPIIIATLGRGDVIGASWLIPPYRWHLDARAVGPVLAIGMDAACLRGKCEQDHDLGYEMMKRFLPIFVKRLHATRLQLLDVYGRD
jgi:CRP/FNR family transcriptional regulator, cyclic AMP receptor protein